MKVIGYGVSSEGYFVRGRENLMQAKKLKFASFWIYAALEFRCCIERILFEYLVIISKNNLSKNIEKLYLSSDLKKTILGIEPEFNSKIDFCNIALEAENIDGEIFQLDLDILNTYYGKLGAYLHSAKRPEDTTENEGWWLNLIGLLNDVESYLIKIVTNPMGVVKINERGEELYRLWKENKITKPEVIHRMKTGK